MMFSRFFKKSCLTANPCHVDDTSMEIFLRDNKTTERVELFLGHTVADSPEPETHDDEIRTKHASDDDRYFQESFVDNDSSPCGSYVDITESQYFDPRDVDTNGDVISTFIRLPLPMSLLSVPGIGVTNNSILEKQGIHNTHQLVGQFLVLESKTTSPGRLADKFYDWLGEVGVEKSRATITASVAEKIGTWIPGFYDVNVYTAW